jgi:hypothetical protein
MPATGRDKKTQMNANEKLKILSLAFICAYLRSFALNLFIKYRGRGPLLHIIHL